MVKVGELSNFKAYIDEKQEVVRSGKMKVKLRPQPVGYAKFIEVEVGFTTKIEN